MSLAVSAVDARVARAGARDERAALVRVERDLARDVITGVVEHDDLDPHLVRQLREVRRRLATLPG